MNWSQLLERWQPRLQAIVNMVVKDWPWKLAAFLLALFLFFTIRQSISYSQTLNLTVETELDAGSLSLKGFEPNTVRVTFRGPESEIRRLSLRGSEPPRVRLRLSQPPAGSTSLRVPLSVNDVICEEDLRIVSIEPEVVVAQFDRTETRYLNVSPPLTRGASATEKVKITLEPSYVEISGPSERLDDLAERSVNLATEVIDMTGRTESFTTAVRVQPPDARSSWVLRPETVTANVEITSVEATRTFASLPVKILQSHEGYPLRAVPETVTMEITGDMGELNAIEDETVLAIVDPLVTEETVFPIEAKVQTFLPHNRRVKHVNIIPPSVKLYQKELPLKNATGVEMGKTQ